MLGSKVDRERPHFVHVLTESWIFVAAGAAAAVVVVVVVVVAAAAAVVAADVAAVGVALIEVLVDEGVT